MSATLPPLPIQSTLSDDHLQGIGLVIAQWASMETLLVHAVCDLMAGAPSDYSGRDISSLAILKNTDARILLGLAKTLYCELFPKEADEFSRLVDKIDKLRSKRNVVAHALWKTGKRNDSIQTKHVRTVGKIKVEVHAYTARELILTAHRIQSRGEQFAALLQSHGLLTGPP